MVIRSVTDNDAVGESGDSWSVVDILLLLSVRTTAALCLE